MNNTKTIFPCKEILIMKIRWSWDRVIFITGPESMVHGVYMGPTWGRQDPAGPHVDPMILAIWGDLYTG